MMTHVPSPPPPADRTQDAQIAEALGLKIERPRPGDVDEIYYFVRDKPDVPGPGEWRPLLRYSSDPVAFDSLMQEIGKRGLGPRYINVLAGLLQGDAAMFESWSGESYEAWSLVSAPQSIRAAAALAVLREAKTNG